MRAALKGVPNKYLNGDVYIFFWIDNEDLGFWEQILNKIEITVYNEPRFLYSNLKSNC